MDEELCQRHSVDFDDFLTEGGVGVEAFFLVDRWDGDLLNSFLQHCLSRIASNERLISIINLALFAGRSPIDAMRELAENDTSHVCAYQFTQHEAAYQCRTCQTDSTCIQCMPCFQNADHTGHDTRMTEAGGGGCCDCGDPASWLPEGFCSKHQGPSQTQVDPSQTLDPELYRSSHAVLRFVATLLSNSLAGASLCFTLSDEIAAQSAFARRACGADVAEEEQEGIVYLLNDDEHSFHSVTQTVEHVLRALPTSAMELVRKAHCFERSAVFVGPMEECKRIQQSFSSSDLATELRIAASSRPTVLPYSRFQALLAWLGGICKESSVFRRMTADILELPFKDMTSTETVPNPDTPGLEDLVVHLTNGDNLVVEMSDSEDTLEQRSKRNSLLSVWIKHDFGFAESSRRTLTELIFQLMIEPDFKESFAFSFFRFYEDLLGKYSTIVQAYRRTCVEYSVQLLTIEKLACKLLRHLNLLGTFCSTLHDALVKHVDEDGLLNPDDMDDETEVVFRTVLHDVNYAIESKEAMQIILFERVHFFEQWMALVGLLDGANPKQRQIGAHVMFESESWFKCFNMELRFGDPMGHILGAANQLIAECSHSVRTEEKTELASVLLHHLFRKVHKTIRSVVSRPPSEAMSCSFLVARDKVSVHIPSIRLAVEVLLCLLKGGISVAVLQEIYSKFFSTELNLSLGQCVMELPLRVKAAVVQIQAGLWVRNGTGVKQEILNYFGILTRTMCDPDLHALQIGAAIMYTDQFMKVFLHRIGFKLDTLCPGDSDWTSEERQSVMERTLSLLVNILSDRDGVGSGSERDKLRRQLIIWMIPKPCTFSQILSFMRIPSRKVSPLKEILSEIATFRQPSDREPGRYFVKPEYFKFFDPYAILQDIVREAAVERYKELTKNDRSAIYPPPPELIPLAPPFRSILKLFGSHILIRLLRANLTGTEVATAADHSDNSGGGDDHTDSSISRARAAKRMISGHCLRIISIGVHECLNMRMPPESNHGFFRALRVNDEADPEIPASPTGPEIPSNMTDPEIRASMTDPLIPTEAKVHSTESGSLLERLCARAIHGDAMALWIVEKLKLLDRSCGEIIDELMPTRIADDVASADELREKKRKRAERARSRTMSRIGRQSLSFLNKIQNMSTNVPSASPTNQRFPDRECILCKSSEDSEKMCLVGSIRPSNYIRSTVMVPPGPPAHRTVTDNIPKSAANLTDVNIQFCGHCVHSVCFELFFDELKQKRNRGVWYEGMQSIALQNGEFMCPLCRNFSNIAFPMSKIAPPRHQSIHVSDCVIDLENWLNDIAILGSENKWRTDDGEKIISPLSLRSLGQTNLDRFGCDRASVFIIQEARLRAMSATEIDKRLPKLVRDLAHIAANCWSAMNCADSKNEKGFAKMSRAAVWNYIALPFAERPDVTQPDRYPHGSLPAGFALSSDPFRTLVKFMSLDADLSLVAGEGPLTRPSGTSTIHALHLMWMVKVVQATMHMYSRDPRWACQHAHARSSCGFEEQSPPLGDDVKMDESDFLSEAQTCLPIPSEFSDFLAEIGFETQTLPGSALCSCSVTHQTLVVLCLPFLRQSALLFAAIGIIIPDDALMFSLPPAGKFAALISTLSLPHPTELLADRQTRLLLCRWMGRLQKEIADKNAVREGETSSSKIQFHRSEGKSDSYPNNFQANSNGTQSYGSVSQSSNSDSPPGSSASQSSIATPLLGSSIPQSNNSASQSSNSVPQSNNFASQSSTSVPQSNNFVPQSSSSVSQSNTFASQSSNSVQQLNTFVPQSNALKSLSDVVRELCSEELLAYAVPSLVELPEKFDEIFQMAHHGSCHYCKRTPSKPAICLFCGKFMCYGKDCKSSPPGTLLPKGRLTTHAHACGKGLGMFLCAKRNLVFLLSDGYAVRFGSPYLNEHGENDSDLNQGLPLFLNDARFQRLKDLARDHEIASEVCRKRNFLYYSRPIVANSL
eukprot:960444_1